MELERGGSTTENRGAPGLSPGLAIGAGGQSAIVSVFARTSYARQAPVPRPAASPHGSALPLRDAAIGRNQRSRIGPFRQVPRLEGAARPVAGTRPKSSLSGPLPPRAATRRAPPAEAPDERLELLVRNDGHFERGRPGERARPRTVMDRGDRRASTRACSARNPVAVHDEAAPRGHDPLAPVRPPNHGRGPGVSYAEIPH
jgi:hypothetical protein